MSSSDLSEWASEDDAPALLRPKFKSRADEVEWERKQRNREYRVAARREKRTRKADEKKQRKLNATILRRMTKNPDKYNKNVDRNRRREIELERRKIYKEAVQQAERLAAIHDPSGKLFNVGPVVIQEDGKVVSLESLQRRARMQAEKDAKLSVENNSPAASSSREQVPTVPINKQIANVSQDYIDLATLGLNQLNDGNEPRPKRLSKNQQKKIAFLEERPPPPKPVIPDGFKIPEGEENWVSLWDLSDDELERRVVREKRRKAAERKALRQKQKEGKAERRAARDERRRVYREKKLEWKAIKEEEKRQKRKLLRVEQEEAKRIEIEVNVAERRRAMEVCAELGFTFDNVEGVADIKPKALGMKGQEVDFDILEIGNRPSELKVKDEKKARELENAKTKWDRVDLGKVVDESKTKTLTSIGTVPAGLEGDFVSLDFGGGVMDQQFEALNYNHKLRRKLHRAIEAAQIQKELLVRAKARESCVARGVEVPPELAADYKPIKLAGRRILEDGTLETEKQERVRKRLELAEYNKAAKVLRQQAKAEAIEAGLRVFAELTGKLPVEANEAAPSQAEEEMRSSGIDNDIIELGISRRTHESKKRRRETEHTDMNTSERTKMARASSLNSGNSAYEISHNKESRLEDKKRKKTHEQDIQIGQLDRNDDEAAQITKKRKVKKKHKLQETSGGNLPDTVSPSKQTVDVLPKEVEKSKVQRTEYLGIPSMTGIVSVEHELKVRNGYQWNPDALDGNATRKDKFLRLLGAGKNNKDTAESSSQKSRTKIKPAALGQMENELERQFEAGIRRKHEGQRKRGLGT